MIMRASDIRRLAENPRRFYYERSQEDARANRAAWRSLGWILPEPPELPKEKRMNSMFRMRAILLAIVFATMFAQGVIVDLSIALGWRFAIAVFDLVLFLAASTVLTFSFVQIGQTVDGQLCFDPDNFYWRVMRAWYGKTWGDRVSLCKSYWLTVSLLACFAMMVAIIVGAAFAIHSVVTSIVADPAAAGKQVVDVLMIVVPIAVCIGIVGWLVSKYAWARAVGISVYIGAMLVLVIGFPIRSISKSNHITILAATGRYSLVGLAAVAAAGAVVLLVWLAFKYLPALKDTWLTRLFKFAKGGLCPILVACPIAEQLPGGLVKIVESEYAEEEGEL